MTPSVRRAAAFVYATGSTPKGLHGSTRNALRRIAPYRSGVRCVCGVMVGDYVVEAEHLAAVRADPLAQGHDLLTACGFNVVRDGRRSTSHSIAYRHPVTGDEGHAWRGGGGSVWVRRGSVPYQVTMPFDKEHAATYLASVRPGQLIPWVTWRDLAKRMATYRELDAYSETDAMGAHAAGNDPLAYARRAVLKALDG